jgi:copper resistance protein B
MARMMQMDDAGTTGQVLLDELEWWHTGSGDAGAWRGQGWYGGDYDKLWIRSEGERGTAAPSDARVEVLWDRIISRWWSLQAGVREDVDRVPGAIPSQAATQTRTWAAVGIQGVAPGWFDVEATFYVGEQGRTALRLRSTYDMFLTQRLILQPEIEANLYDRADPARLIGAGLSDLQAGIRLRYEIRRELAPYIGVAGTWRFGATADQWRSAGYSPDEFGLVLGVRAWF